MSPDWVELDDLGVLRIRGPDAVPFLQGQLSNDLARLEREGSLLAGFHNPQGRTIALLRLARIDADDLLALLPRELVTSVATRLARFVLRAKVRLADDSAAWRVRGLVRPEQPEGLAIRVADAPVRWITLAADASMPHEAPVPTDRPSAPDERRRAWRLLDVASGLPQVYARTSEQFVAQMLNLDAIDAISFSKGCYTGQEVIARAHYRGRVKRRMQRWRTARPTDLSPGDGARLADGRTLRIVEAAALDDGRCEFLAVAPLATGTDDEPSTSADKPLLEAEPLPLPYALAS